MNEKQNHVNQYTPYPYPSYPYYYPATQPAFYPPQNQQGTTAHPQTMFRQQQQPTPGIQVTQQGINVPGMLPIEQSFIENILRLNKGKLAKVYMTFENNTEWNAKVFTGIIEAAGRDHIILSDPDTGHRYLLLMLYLDYVEFQEEINYTYPGA